MKPRPSAHCIICGTPFEGALGSLSRLFGISRSRRSSRLCSRCDAHATEGNVGEVSVLFADLSGFTSMTHELGPERAHEVVNAYLQMATEILVRHDAFIDKFVGDSVMAIFNAPIRRADHARRAVAAGLDIQAGMPGLSARFGRELKARIGIAAGPVRLGRLGSGDANDYTALGDAVNLSARLQERALPGEVLVESAAYEGLAADFPSMPIETLRVKGLENAVTARRLTKACSAPFVATEVADPDRAIRAGSLVFAVLGAPCAAAALIGPAAAQLGLAALFASTSAVAFFDRPIVRIPMLALSALGITASVYTCWHAYRIRLKSTAEGRPTPMTPDERSRVLMIALSAVAIVFVAVAEVWAHRKMHQMG
jgi:adenylate cyclase